MKILACAAEDPLDPRTFSGYSSHLFSAMAAASNEIVSIATRTLRPEDLFHGALKIDGVLRWPPKRPRLNPNWYWSKKSFEAMSDRFDRALRKTSGVDAIVQIGTHVMPRNSAAPFYCVIDSTIRQGAESGEFSISTARPSVIKEAVACQREVLGRCTRIFTLSEWTARGIVSDYGTSHDKISIIGAGANVPATFTRRINTAVPSILFVGYDWKRKGGPLLLECFKLVRQVIPNAELVIVGCSPPVQQQGVRIIGKLDRRSEADRRRLLDLYAEASVFAILPTFDPFPNVLLEAALFGLPVVSVDEGSRREAVIDETTGLLAKSRDSKEIAGIFIRLLTDVALVTSLGNAARQRASERFTWPVVARRVLDEITGGSPSSDTRQATDRVPT